MSRSPRISDPEPAEDFASLVREQGLRATPATLLVLQILSHAQVPLTHEEIQGAFAGNTDAPPDRVTLYRVLERLTAVGLCDTLTGADRRSRFTLHAKGSGHVFECAQCHKVVPLPQDPELPAALERLRKTLKRKGMQTQESMVTLRGTCGDCGSSPHESRKR